MKDKLILIIKGIIIGALKEAKVFKGNNSSIAKLLNSEDYKTLAKYMGKAKSHVIGEWTMDYVAPQ